MEINGLYNFISSEQKMRTNYAHVIRNECTNLGTENKLSLIIYIIARWSVKFFSMY